MSSRSAWLKDDILSQIAEQIKALQLGQQNAEADGNQEHQVTSKNIHLQCLLDLLDHVLLHGLQNVELGYWPFVCNFTHSETTKVITQHPQVTNDLDKGRVWVYTAISEGLLESYFRMLIEMPNVAKKFYTKQAFVRDKERLIVLQTLVSGLDFINILLEQNCPYLGYGSLPGGVTDKPQPYKPPVANHGTIVISSPNSRKGSNSTASSCSNSSTITGCVSPRSAGTSECGSSDTLLDSGDEDSSTIVEQKSDIISQESHSSTRVYENTDLVSNSARKTSVNEDLTWKEESSADTGTWTLTLVESEFPVEHSTPVSEDKFTQDHPDEFPRFFTEKDCDGNFSTDGEIVFDRKQKKKRASSKKKTRGASEREGNGRDTEDGDLKISKNEESESCGDKVDGSEEIKVIPAQTNNSAPETSPIKSDVYPSSSTDSLCGSIYSTDSLDQFCRDFDSSVNTTNSDNSLDNTTIQICSNEDTTLKEEISPFAALDPRFRTNTGDSSASSESNHSSSNPGKRAFKREKSQYEGIILGLPKRPSTDEGDGSSCDVRLDQNAILMFSLEIFHKNGEQFQRMIRVTTGHQHGHLQPAYVILTDTSIYILRRVPSKDGRNLKLEMGIPFSALKKIEIGMAHQMVTIVSKATKYCLTIADAAVCRDFLSSLESLLEVSMHKKQTAALFSTSTTQQESKLMKWLQEDEKIQASSAEIACFSLVHWYGAAGPDTGIEVLRFQSVKEGYLDIKQQQLLGGVKWTQGYFALTNGTLCQYVKHSLSKDEKSAKLILDLRGAQGGGCRRVQDPERSYAFQLISSLGSPLMTLAASSEGEVSDWMYKICQWIAGTFDSNEDRGCTILSSVPCCLVVTKEKIVLCLGDPSDGNFRLLSSCSVEAITGIFVDNEVRNYCILKFKPNEVVDGEGSWFLWFRSEHELGTFERAVSECWKDLFQVDLQFLVVGEGNSREKARGQSSSIEEFYNE